MSTRRPLRSDSKAALSTIEAAVLGEPLLSIADVERETGLGKDTLRAWERRYGFPLPRRDAAGMRGYPRSLVERLRLVRRALLRGQRPGRLFALPPHELDVVLTAMAAGTPAPASDAGTPVLRHAPGVRDSMPAPDALPLADGLAAIRRDGADALRHWLALALARLGLAAFVDGLVPLTAAIGNAWLGGAVAVHEEHLYCEAVQSVLRGALLPLQAASAGNAALAPRVLLTTVPGEAHGLGLLMAEAVLTLESCRCVPLGTQTPAADIAAAVGAYRIDVVALGFSESLPGPQALAALQDVRARLPAGVALWAGGGSAALRAPRLPGIHVVPRLAELADAVARWRQDHSPTVDSP